MGKRRLYGSYGSGEIGSSGQARTLEVGTGVTFMRTGAVLELRTDRQPPE